MERAAGVTPAEGHAVSHRTLEVGDGHDVGGAARELDELGQDAAAGDIKCAVDAVWRQCADSLDQAGSVGDRLCPQRAQITVIGGTRGADHLRPTRHGELDGSAADASGGAVDEHRAAACHAELIERAGGRLDGRREGRRAREVKRRRDRGVVGQHRQFGLGGTVGGEAEHPIADGHVAGARAELVDDPRCLVAHRLRELLIHQAPALLPIAGVDAGRPDRDTDLPGTRMRFGEIHDLEDLWAAELAEPGGLHPWLRSRPLGLGSPWGPSCFLTLSPPLVGSLALWGHWPFTSVRYKGWWPNSAEGGWTQTRSAQILVHQLGVGVMPAPWSSLGTL